MFLEELQMVNKSLKEARLRSSSEPKLGLGAELPTLNSLSRHRANHEDIATLNCSKNQLDTRI
jgi:hypothetical protein